METFLILAMTTNVILLIMIANKSQRGLQFLLYTLSGFWVLSFVIRPLIFLYSRDNNISSAIYDFRIGQSEANFWTVMLPIVVGCFVFCLPLLTHIISKKSYLSAGLAQIDSNEYRWLILYGYSCGFLAIILENSNFRNPVSKSLTILVAISFSVFLWKRPTLKFSIRTQGVVFVIGGLGTVLLSVTANNSKGILLMPLLVYISSLNLWRKKGTYLKKILLSMSMALLAIPIFSILQFNKLGSSFAKTSTSYEESLPWALSPFLSLSVRFDQFSRVADVHFASPNPFGGLSSWSAYFLKNLMWNPASGRSELSFGQEWNQLVTNQSIPGSRLSSVSLAQGMIAEGLVWAGFTSLVIECIFMSCVFVWVGTLLQKSSLSVFLAFGLVGNATIFEMGSVQFAEVFSSSIKIFVFLWLSKKILFESFRNS
jgi:hypothetical protein